MNSESDNQFSSSSIQASENAVTELNVSDKVCESESWVQESEGYQLPLEENRSKPRSMPSANQAVTAKESVNIKKRFESSSSQEATKESQEWQLNPSANPSPENGAKHSKESTHSPPTAKLNQPPYYPKRTPSPSPIASGGNNQSCSAGMSAGSINGTENGIPRDSGASRANSPATGSGNSSLDSGSLHVSTPPTTLINDQDNIGLNIPDNVSRSSESGRSYDSLYYQKTPETPLKPDVSSVKSGKSGEKKKKSSAWYNMLNPTYKSRSDDFKRLFKDLPESERLIVDYSCAMQKDILVHGRLYVSQNYICFYANIFRWETFLVIQCRDIASMTKEKTARVIPNAIQICTSNEKHFFTSFGARDKTYLMLFRVWQNALIEQPMSSQELWTWVHHSYGDELGLTSDDDDYVSPHPIPLGTIQSEDDKSFHLSDDPSFLDKESGHILLSDKLDLRVRANDGGIYNSSLDLVNGSTDSPIIPKKMGKQPKDPQTQKAKSVSDYPPTDLSDTTESDLALDGGEVFCQCESHLGKEVLNTTFQIAVDQLFNYIFTKSKFMLDLLDSRKTYDVMETPWQLSSETNHKMRQLTYTLTLNHSMAKTAQTTDTQRLLQQTKQGQLYVVDCEIVNTGIPYSDTFSVKSQYCFTKISKNETRLRVHGFVHYKKSAWGLIKSLIEKTAMQGLSDFCVDLEVALRKEEGIAQPMGKKIRRRKRTKTIDLKDVPKEMAKVIQSQTISRKSIPAIVGNEAASAGPTSDLVIRVILATLVTLLLLNGLLFYKLWSLEDQSLQLAAIPIDFELPLDGNPSSETLLRLLRQQEILHRSEIEKWKDAVGDVIKLIRLMENSLSDLKSNIESYGNSAFLKSVSLVNPPQPVKSQPANPTSAPTVLKPI